MTKKGPYEKAKKVRSVLSCDAKHLEPPETSRATNPWKLKELFVLVNEHYFEGIFIFSNLSASSAGTPYHCFSLPK
jgi:hypothetical protein